MIQLGLIILVRTITDLSFKGAVNHIHFNKETPLMNNIKKIAKNPLIYLGFAMGLTNVVLWIDCLKTYDLSYAYPFLSISYITIIIAGKFLFHEHIGLNKAIGIGFITCGAALLTIG